MTDPTFLDDWRLPGAKVRTPDALRADVMPVVRTAIPPSFGPDAIASISIGDEAEVHGAQLNAHPAALRQLLERIVARLDQQAEMAERRAIEADADASLDAEGRRQARGARLLENLVKEGALTQDAADEITARQGGTP